MNIADFSPEKLTNSVGDFIQRRRSNEVGMGTSAVAKVYYMQQKPEEDMIDNREEVAGEVIKMSDYRPTNTNPQTEEARHEPVPADEAKQTDNVIQMSDFESSVRLKLDEIRRREDESIQEYERPE